MVGLCGVQRIPAQESSHIVAPPAVLNSCELSCTGIRCTPHRPTTLAQLPRNTGVNIVHATGFYCHEFLSEAVHSSSEEQMTQTMMNEVC